MTKEKFITIMNELQNYDKAIDNLHKADHNLALAIVEGYDLKDTVIKSLEAGLDLKESQYGTDISWWVYETKYGKENNKVWIGNKKNKKQKEFEIKTAEDLYDLITGKLK
jgi:hypothetical protein